jgi:hypothetical protein
MELVSLRSPSVSLVELENCSCDNDILNRDI